MIYNKIIKNSIVAFLIFSFINTPVFATNLVTITAENGKSADLDLDSIKMSVDTVEYNIYTEKDDFTYVNRFSSELYKEGSPTAIIQTTKYKNDEIISSKNYNERNYRELKAGTLQAEIFDVLSKDLSMKDFNKGQNTWDKYLNKQRKTIQKYWKPGKFKYLNGSHIHNDIYTTPVYMSDVTLKVDKNGIVKELITDDYRLNEVPKLDPLPEDYTAETFELGVNLNYYKYAGAKTNTKKPLVAQISPTKATIKIAKNSRPPVLGHIQLGLLKCIRINRFFNKLSPGMILLLLPIELASLPLTLVAIILFAMFGGDSADI